MDTNYHSIYNIIPYRDANYTLFTNDLISIIKKCIELGLNILNNDTSDYRILYPPYVEFISLIKIDITLQNISPIVTDSYGELVPYIFHSVELLKNDFPDYNEPGNRTTHGEILNIEGEEDYNIEYYNNIYRINILTNHILLSNILYILQCLVIEANSKMYELCSDQNNKKDLQILKLEDDLLMVELRNEENNKKKDAIIQKLEDELKLVKNTNRLNIEKIHIISNNLERIKNSIGQSLSPYSKIKYTKKCLKYYLKSFYLDIENSLKKKN
jgi:hypothetical protein